MVAVTSSWGIVEVQHASKATSMMRLEVSMCLLCCGRALVFRTVLVPRMGLRLSGASGLVLVISRFLVPSQTVIAKSISYVPFGCAVTIQFLDATRTIDIS